MGVVQIEVPNKNGKLEWETQYDHQMGAPAIGSPRPFFRQDPHPWARGTVTGRRGAHWRNHARASRPGPVLLGGRWLGPLGEDQAEGRRDMICKRLDAGVFPRVLKGLLGLGDRLTLLEGLGRSQPGIAVTRRATAAHKSFPVPDQ